ncbi:tetratricopeptide repeat protein [Actinoplanes sp. NPDC049596]|uniref:tetratricopeptide repeat protein n=1 Tax=unclassified Actinoplanes TaxID=2626549 RepID=UPI003416A53E
MHDLVRIYAGDCAEHDETSEYRDSALRRFIDHYLFTAYGSDRLIAEYRRPIDIGSPVEGSNPIELPDDPAAMGWFSIEHSNMLAVQRLAGSRNLLDRVWQFAWVLDNFHWRRGHIYDDIATWSAGLDAAQRMEKPFEIGLAHRRLGRAYGRAKRYDLALEHMTAGLRMAEAAHDVPGQAHSQRIVSWIYQMLDENSAALAHARASLELYRSLANPVWEAHALNQLGECHMRLGEYGTARENCAKAYALHNEYRHTAGEAESLTSLGAISLLMGQDEDAVRYYRDALKEYRRLGNTYDEAIVLEHLGGALVKLDQRAEADESWRQALELYTMSHRKSDADRVAALLNQAGRV